MRTGRFIELTLTPATGNEMRAKIDIDTITMLGDAIIVDQKATAEAQNAEMAKAHAENRQPQQVLPIYKHEGTAIYLKGESTRFHRTMLSMEEVEAKIAESVASDDSRHRVIAAITDTITIGLAENTAASSEIILSNDYDRIKSFLDRLVDENIDNIF